MRRRMPWMLVFGLGAGLLLVPAVRRVLGKRLGERTGGRGGAARHLPREPEVVRGTVPPGDSERPVASAAPDLVPDRVSRAVPPPRHPAATDAARFEPVVPDAPELRDPSAEPPAGESGTDRAEPVPPTVRKRR